MIWTDYLNALCFAGSIFIQGAQINRILKHKSVIGLSETSWILQCVSSASFVAYGYCSEVPFKQWGETVIVLGQYLFIVYLIWLYSGQKSSLVKITRGGLVILLGIYIYFTITKGFSKWLLLILGIIPLPSVLASKGPQIRLNYVQKHTGELSPVSISMQCIGNFARTIVASFSSHPDPLILATHALALSLAAILLSQIVYYKANTAAILKRKRDDDDVKTSPNVGKKSHDTVSNRKGLVRNRISE